jgi:hypothetical protein
MDRMYAYMISRCEGEREREKVYGCVCKKRKRPITDSDTSKICIEKTGMKVDAIYIDI